MTRYMWVRVPVDIYNRDRAGGHDGALVRDDFGYREEATPKTAKAIKKASRRKQRREASRIKQAALAAMVADHEEDMMEAIGLDLDYDDFDMIPLEYESEFEEVRFGSLYDDDSRFNLDDIMDYYYDWD